MRTKVAHEVTGTSGGSLSGDAARGRQQEGAAAAEPPGASDPPPKLPLTPEIERRCAGTLGTWCVDYYTQGGMWATPPPRGNKTCSLDCNKARTWAV